MNDKSLAKQPWHFKIVREKAEAQNDEKTFSWPWNLVGTFKHEKLYTWLIVFERNEQNSPMTRQILNGKDTCSQNEKRKPTQIRIAVQKLDSTDQVLPHRDHSVKRLRKFLSLEHCSTSKSSQPCYFGKILACFTSQIYPTELVCWLDAIRDQFPWLSRSTHCQLSLHILPLCRRWNFIVNFRQDFDRCDYYLIA